MRALTLQSRTALRRTLRQEAKKFGLAIDLEHFACAFSEEAFVACVPVSGTDELTDVGLKNGAEFLFVYFSVPSRAASRVDHIRSGFYVVKIFLNAKTRNGAATFLNAARREVASFPLQVASAHDRPMKMSTRVSGHIDWCSASVDALIRRIVFRVHVKWC